MLQIFLKSSLTKIDILFSIITSDLLTQDLFMRNDEYNLIHEVNEEYFHKKVC